MDNYFISVRGFAYIPGTTPEAPDWDGGKAECGGGLHFCALPGTAKTYFPEATRFVACPIALEDIVVTQNPIYPNKIKARRIFAPIYEVNENGEPLKTE